MTTANEHPFDYSAFEACFRGSRNDVKRRLSAYIPFVKQLPLDIPGSALDIGCGRGEWLELLGDHAIRATGIDMNKAFVEKCRQRDLDCQEADLFDFLEQQKSKIYSLITGFHLIEHISLDRQLWFLNAVFRLLAPGGVVILETTNPENVTVGCCNFYIDPTHLRPVPPQLLHFLALQSGFASPIIARLNRHTVGAPLRMMAASEPGAAHYNQLLEIVASRMLQAPDYALIAFKPPSPDAAMLDAVSAINKVNESFLLPPFIPSISSNTADKSASLPLRSNEHSEEVNSAYTQLLEARNMAKIRLRG